MKNWIKNHQKLASVLGLTAFAGAMTGLYFLTGWIGGHYDDAE